LLSWVEKSRLKSPAAQDEAAGVHWTSRELLFVNAIRGKEDGRGPLKCGLKKGGGSRDARRNKLRALQAIERFRLRRNICYLEDGTERVVKTSILNKNSAEGRTQRRGEEGGDKRRILIKGGTKKIQ